MKIDYFVTTGYLILTYYLAAVIIRFILGIPHDSLWLSHATLPLLGLGFILKNKLLTTAAGIILLIPHLLWSVDYFLRILALPSIGMTDYLVHAHPLAYMSTIHHFVTPALIIWSFVVLGVHKRAWLLATTFFLFMTTTALLITPAELNINCAYEMCHALQDYLPTPPMYWLALHLLVLALLFLQNKVFIKLFDKKKG